MDLVDLARRPFADVAHAISGAVVYMDEGAGECAHHAAGAGFILGLGAVNVLSLERVAGTVAEATPPIDVAGLPVDPRTPVAIFTTRLLQRSKGDLLRCVGVHPAASAVAVFCAVSEEAHVAAAHAVATASGDPHAAQASGQSYERIVRDLRLAASAIMSDQSAQSSSTMKSPTPKKTGRTPKKPTPKADGGWDDDDGGDGWGDDWGETESEKSDDADADASFDGGADQLGPSFDVRYFPMPFTPLTRGAFVMPANGAAAGAAVAMSSYRGAGAHPKSLAHATPPADDGGDEDGAHAPVPPGIAVLGNQLAALGAHMGARLECFALGRTARAVARAAAAAAAPEAGRYPPPSTTAALVIVDRTCDMLTPAAVDDGFLHRALLANGTPGDSFTGDASADPVASTGPPEALPSASARVLGDANRDFAAPGSVDGVLAHPRDVEACRRLGGISARSVDDAAIATRRWLREATDAEGVRPKQFTGDPRAGAAVTAEELAAFAAPLVKDPSLNARYRALLELASAVASSLPSGKSGKASDVDGWSRRRGTSLAAILAEAHTAANRRRGDGSAATAAAQALVACLRDVYGPCRPGAGMCAEAAALCVAGMAAAAEAGNTEGGGDRFHDEEGDDDDDIPRPRHALRRTPLSVDDEAAVRDALVDAVLAPPAGQGGTEPDPAREQYEWLGELGERIAEYWATHDAPPPKPSVRAPPPRSPSDPVKPAVSSPKAEAEDGWGDDGWGDDDDDWGDEKQIDKSEPARVNSAPVHLPPPAPAPPDADPEDFELAALRLEANDRVGSFLRRVGELVHGRREMRSSAGALLGEGAGAHEPLVRELVARIGAGADDEGVGADLFHVASSLGGLLRGGVGAAMGRLGFKSTVVTKPKPSDHARVVLFVIGGLTPCEIREIGSIAEDVRAAFESGASRHSGVKVEDVCVGGTGLLVGDRDFLRLVCE